MKNMELKIKNAVDSIILSCKKYGGINHIRGSKLPSKQHLILTINDLLSLIFPGYYGSIEVTKINLEYIIGETCAKIYNFLSKQIEMSLRHECTILKDCEEIGRCVDDAQKITLDLLENIPMIRRLVMLDVDAIFQGDPAAKNIPEIILAYPGIKAIAIQRIANFLYKNKIPFIPRMLTEYAHEETGIDIHPGAKIGERFCIDHGTGVVIGETTEIGRNVKIYQGVTLGALSIPKILTAKDRAKKRHPTICDNVTIYAEATILGGKTIIGENSIIGGNVWLTKSVPPNTKVSFESQYLIFDTKGKKTYYSK